MTYTVVKNLKWANSNNTLLSCTVKFDFLDEEVPYSTTADSDTDYGREIFEKAVNGDFGPISAYNRNINSEWNVVRFKRDNFLKDSDYTQLPDVQSTMSTSKKTEWLNYRQQLRDITSTFSDPADVIWPTIPTN